MTISQYPRGTNNYQLSKEIIRILSNLKNIKQAGAELGQAKDKLKFVKTLHFVMLKGTGLQIDVCDIRWGGG